MKSKHLLTCITVLLVSALLYGCGEAEEEYATYDLYSTSYEYGITRSPYVMQPSLYAEDLCLTSMSDLHTEETENASCAYASGLFNLDTKETIYAQNMNERIYPASTTKILTSLVALKYADPETVITVSEHAVDQVPDASLAYLKAGDRLTLRQLLYGLLLPSGNDAAVAIAEGVAGDEASFAELMNKEAQALGATHSHFVTVNGLHDDDHYTTVYDMYLIFSEAMKYPDFVTAFCTDQYDASYTAADGSAVNKTWKATTWYLNGKADDPAGIHVLGGKTGTTGEARSCLVLLSENERKEKICSIIFKADYREQLYVYMTEMLEKFGNVQ